VQGTFALTIDGRGFGSKSRPARLGQIPLVRMRLVRRLRPGLPHRGAEEKAVTEIGKPERAVVTTCAYCGVGCTFRAEMRGEQLVRMVPWKDGKANRGHSCVKGRFAWGYAQHQDRILKPMIRESIDEPWREVSWEEALGFAARAQAISPSTAGRRWAASPPAAAPTRRLPRAEAGARRLRQQQRRYLRARLPFAHRLWPEDHVRHLGRHAGLRFGRGGDVILVIGANPTDGHPVFGSRMKKRLRQGRS
jgi:formate dehydrogenase major subunit